MVSEDSDQLLPGFLAVHRLSDLDDLDQTLAGQMMTAFDQLNAPCKLLEVLLLRGVHRMPAEEGDDDPQKILPPPHDETVQVLLVVVIPGVNQYRSNPKELTEFV